MESASDVQKMREALLEIETVAGEAVENGTMELPQYSKIVDIAEAALSAPPRNCDVGTPDEQGERCLAQFNEWRRKSDGEKLITAIMAWMQTPYEQEGGAK